MDSKRVLAFLMFLISIASAYQLDGGGGVSFQNNYGRISVYPATLTDLLNVQFMNITSNITGTLNLDAAFEFNTSELRPLQASYWASNVPHIVPAYVNITEQVYDPETNGTKPFTRLIQNGTQTVYYDDWSDISSLFSKKTYNGLTYYVIENVSFSKGQTRQLRLQLMANPNTDGKYGLWLKRSSDSWSDVINNLAPGVYLDPWWNTTWNYRIQLNIGCPGPNCDNGAVLPIFFNNVTQMNKMGVSGASLRYIVECGASNFTQRGLHIKKWNAGANFTAFVNYTNDTSCSHYLYYNNSGASSVSSPYQVWEEFDDYDDASFNTSKFFGYTSTPWEGDFAQHQYVGTRYGQIATSNITTGYCDYLDYRIPAGTGNGAVYFATRWNGGAIEYGYIWCRGARAGLCSANSLSVKTTTVTMDVAAMTTNTDQNYLIRRCINSTLQNFTRQQVASDELASNSWTSLDHRTGAVGVSTGDITIYGAGNVASQNTSLYWYGRSRGVNIPYLSSLGAEETSGGPAAYSATLCNGTACSALGTLYYNEPTALNASGNCTHVTISPLTGFFSFYRNSTALFNYTTYNWVGNQTNYTNTSVSGAQLKKSDTWYVSLICFDGTTNSSASTSSSYTVNNTAPTIGAPSITSNIYGFTNESILTCTNGTYSDADSDPQNVTGFYRWFLNGTVLAGQTIQNLNCSNSTVRCNATDRIICEWQAQDTGYDRKNASNGPQNSSQIIINSKPVVNSVSWCEGVGCSAISSTYANTILNCRANVTDIDNSTIHRTVFYVYQNGTYLNNKTVYNGANNTNILMSTNSSLTGIPKSNNLMCGVYANDLMQNSTWLNATSAITINNTAPSIGTPWITSNETSNTTYYNYSVVTCNFGNYSDPVDADVNGSAFYRWWKNGIIYVGLTASFVNFTSLSNTTDGDIWNCSAKQMDSGYDAKNSTETFSAGITVGAVGTPSITNCSTGFNVLNFTLWDEENWASMNGTMEITITLYNSTMGYVSNSSFIYYNQHVFPLCINPYAATAYIDTFQTYYSNTTLAQYPQRNYFLLRALLNASAPQVIPLYLENSSYAKQTTIYIQDEVSRGIPGVYIAFQRFYPGTNTYLLIAMSKTNDEGLATAYLRPVDPYYREVVYQADGTILNSFTPAFIPCDPGDTNCKLILQIKETLSAYYWTVTDGIAHNCTYTNATGSPLVACTFLDTSGMTKNVTLTVFQITSAGPTTICTNTTTSTMGTLLCSLPGTSGSYGWRLIASINPTLTLETGEYTWGQVVTFGAFGLFIAALFIMGLGLMGAMFGSPPLAIAFTVIGFVASWVMNLIVVGGATVLGVVVIGVILVFLTRRT